MKANVVFVLLSLVYIVFELSFNAALLNASSDVVFDNENFRNIELFGRFISASGFTLLVISLFSIYNYCFDKAFFKALVLPLIILCAAPLLVDEAWKDTVYLALVLTSSFALLIGLGPIKMRLFVNVVALIILAWSGMFYGQKVIIEHYIIDRSSVENRLHAQYMTLLKAGLTRGLINIEDAPFKTVDATAPTERSFIALVGSLIINNQVFIQNVKSHEDKIIKQSILDITRRRLDSDYATYQQYGNEFQAVWSQYKEATALYINHLSFNGQSKAYADMLNELKIGYRNYLKSVKKYKDNIRINIINTVIPKLKAYKKKENNCRDRKCVSRMRARFLSSSKDYIGKKVPLSFFCEKTFGIFTHNNCSKFSVDYITNKLIEVKKDDFLNISKKQYGVAYPPNIESEEDFINSEESSAALRKLLIKKGIKVSNNWWFSDVHEFKAAYKKHINMNWYNNINNLLSGRVRPQLSYNAFILHPVIQRIFKNKMGEHYYQGITLELSEHDFYTKVTIPAAKRKVKNYINGIKKRTHELGNGEARVDEGKNYYRSIIIPPITLFLSLFFTIITTIKLIHIGAGYILSKNESANTKSVFIQLGITTVISILLIVSPLGINNKFTSSSSYKYFSDKAWESNQVLTAMTAWTIRIQPIIYPVGNKINRLAKSGMSFSPNQSNTF